MLEFKMSKGYFIEQTLLLQGDIRSYTLWGKKPVTTSALQKEVEGTCAQKNTVKDFLIGGRSDESQKRYKRMCQA